MKILPPLEEEDTMIAALGYPFWYIVTPLVFLSRKKDEPFVKFHVLQSLFFGLATLGACIILTLILAGIFNCVPSLKGIIREGFVWKGYIWKGIGFVILFIIFNFIFLVGFSMVLYYSYKALRGHYFKLPFIGSFIEKKYFRYLMDDDEVSRGA
jgi:uncharacterized membrane protein